MFIDGVTSVFGTDLRIKELDIDALVFGTQKALALPPGLAIMCCSDRLLEKAKGVPNRGYYFDLVQMKKMADKNYSLTTPPVSLMYALDLQLDRMLKEGMAARYQRHREMAGLVREWAKKHHGLFAEPAYLSDTITVINKGDIDFSKLNKGLKERGYEISNGYGDIKEATFRIGHMGDLTPAEVRGLLKNMDEVLEAM
jgi:aspartate aminotransferase-like enzyme